MTAIWSLLLILLNAYFVICEIILVTVRKTKIEEWVRAGKRRAKFVKYAVRNITLFLPATQVGVTFTSIALGIVGSPWLEKVIEAMLFPYFRAAGLSPTMKSALAFFSFLAITYAQLVFGELLPKTLAMRKPEKYSLWVIPPFYIFVGLFYPLIRLVNMSTYGIIKWFGIRKIFTDRPYSEEEIKLILSHSVKAGEISTVEMDMAYNVFRLKRIKLSKLMIPTDKLITFESGKTVREIEDDISKRKTIFNRYPVYERDEENIVGFVHVTDLFKDDIGTIKDLPLRKTPFVRKILKVSREEKPDKLFVTMQRKNIRVAVIVDKSGRALGIVSLTDIIDHVVKGGK